MSDRLPAVAGTVVAGLGLTIIVSIDGSPPWQAVRLLVAAGLTTVVALLAAGRWRIGASARAASLFGFGALCLAVGVGIGPAHLTKDGLTVLAVAGLSGVLGGLVLVVVGAWSLLRSTPGWWRLLVAPLLLVALFVVTWSVGQAVAATNVPRTAVGDVTPADRGVPYQDVELVTEDGVRLSAWYVPSRNGAAVVLLHGAGSTRSSVVDHAAVLARHGYGALLFDARGHGRSGGRAMDFGWYGEVDTAAAVEYLAGRPEVDADRIGAVGLSMGGEEAIGAGAAVPAIRAVVAEGATNRVAADKEWLADVHGWRGSIQQGIDWLLYTVADVLTEASPPMALRDAVAASAPRPVLLIAGGNVASEADAGRFIAAGAPGSVELWVVPDAGHTAALRTDPEEWERRVVGFLDGALADGGR